MKVHIWNKTKDINHAEKKSKTTVLYMYISNIICIRSLVWKKSLFNWICLFCRKEKPRSKNEWKEQEGKKSEKDTCCVVDITLAPSVKERSAISRSAWKMNLVVPWIEMTYLTECSSSLQVLPNFFSDLFIIYLFIYWIIYLFSWINFSSIATRRKKNT